MCEIHHRVKNNLQIIASLLSLQSESFTNPDILDAFTESKNRIRSMALVHEQLYDSDDFARINFSHYIIGLAHSVMSSYDTHLGNITPHFDVDEEIFLDIDTAIPCGLILNELVSNCLKHAFLDRTGGEIYIGCRSADGQMILIVRDTGVGFPKDLDFQKTESLGLQLVCTLTNQLNGTITLDKSDGTAFQITFPQKENTQ